MNYFKALFIFFSFLILPEVRPAAQPNTSTPAVTQNSIQFEVREEAGIRRRSDVVSTELLPARPFPPETGFRLTQNGEEVPCQFRFDRKANGEISRVDIDFIAHFQPWEQRQYVVEAGQGVSSREPEIGLAVEESPDEFLISFGDHLVWTVRKDLAGLVRYTRLPDVPYVDSSSAGLAFQTEDGETFRLAERKPTRVLILREGPIASSLEFTYSDWPPGGSSKVVLEFVRSKSWVHVTWTCDGPSSVSQMSAALRLILEGKEHLFDFGAGDFVYNTVTTEQIAVLESAPDDRPVWTVSLGTPGKLQPLFQAAADEGPNSRGGWVHLMDESRCTAAAVAGFGKAHHDSIEVDGTGLLRLSRGFSQGTQIQDHSLEFWVHFVRMPVHLGARTSPQAMRSPLKVLWATAK